MKGTGYRIKEKAKATNDFPMVILSKENTYKEKPMGKAYLIGLKEKFTMENGLEALRKAMVYGKVLKEILT